MSKGIFFFKHFPVAQEEGAICVISGIFCKEIKFALFISTWCYLVLSGKPCDQRGSLIKLFMKCIMEISYIPF